MKPNIMFVDDSINVLESLQWIFKDEPYYLFALGCRLDITTPAIVHLFAIYHSIGNRLCNGKLSGINVLYKLK